MFPIPPPSTKARQLWLFVDNSNNKNVIYIKNLFHMFKCVIYLVSERENFDSNINVSVFETNIRIVGN